MKRRITIIAIGVFGFLLLVVFWPGLIAGWQNIRFPYSLHKALDKPIEYVEFQANTDWPKQRLTDKSKIDALKTCLLDTRENLIIRSAPPGTPCEMRFIFEDGHEESIRHSPLRKRLYAGEYDYYREHEVRVSFRGYDRSGSTDAIADILIPPNEP